MSYSHIEGLRLEQEIQYTEIPFFPIISATARRGRVLFGSLNAVRVCLLSGNSLEGLSCEESTFLSQWLVKLGVVNFVHFSLAASLSEIPANSTVLLSDVSEFSTIHSVPPRIFAQFVPKKVFSDLSSESSLGDLTKSPKMLLSIAGSSFPTPAEVSLAKKIGFDLVSNSNYQICYSLSSYGVRVHALACVTHHLSQNPLSSPSKILELQIADSVSSLFKHLSSLETPEGLSKEVFDWTVPHQISYNLKEPVQQADFELVNETAAQIREKWGEERGCVLSLAIFLPLSFSFLPDNISSANQLCCTEYRSLVNCQFLPREGSVQLWKIEGKHVVFFVGRHYMNEGASYNTLTFLDRASAFSPSSHLLSLIFFFS